MRTTGALVAGIAGIALLAGCSSPAPTSPTPNAPTTPPATQPAPAPTESTQPPSVGDPAIDDFLKRVAGAEMKTYTMELDMVTEIDGSQVPMTSTGSFDNTDPAAPRTHMKMQVMGMEMEIIQIGDEAYLKMDALGDQWMKMDAESAAEISSGGSPDLGQWTQEYAENIESVEFVGEEQVSGVTTFHYRLTMKPEALEEFGVPDDAAGAPVGFDVWVDNEGFTRKFTVVVGDGNEASITAILDNFNQPVNIEAPKDWVEMPS